MAAPPCAGDARPCQPKPDLDISVGTRIGLQESMQRFDSTRAPQAQLTRDGGARSGSEESSEILSPPLH